MSPFPSIVAFILAFGFVLVLVGYLTRSPQRTYRGWTVDRWLNELRDDVCRGKACESLFKALEYGTWNEAFFAMLVLSKSSLSAEERNRACSAVRNAIERDDLATLEHIGIGLLVAMQGERAVPDLLRGLESGFSPTVFRSIQDLEGLGKAAVSAIPALDRLHRVGPSWPFDSKAVQEIKVAAGRAIANIEHAHGF